MRFNLVVTGLLFGLVGGFLLGQVGSRELVDMFDVHNSKIIVVCAIVFGIVVGLLLFANRIIAALTAARQTELVGWFEGVSEAVFSVVPLPSKPAAELKQAARDVLAIYISWRTRRLLFATLIAIVVVVVGTISTQVMIEQNKKLDAQNTLLTQQNGAVRMQLLLSEAARYEAYEDRVSELVLKIANDALLWREDERYDLEQMQKDIGEEKVHRPDVAMAWFQDRQWDDIRSTLQLLDPYPVFDTRAITDPEMSLAEVPVHYLSEGRGRILKTLLKERVNTNVTGLNFDYADMRGVQIGPPSDLYGLVTQECDALTTSLHGSSLNKADFSRAFITGVDFPIGAEIFASDAVFHRSQIALPIGRSSAKDDGTPAFVALIDSRVYVGDSGQDGEKLIPFDGVIFVVDQVRRNGDNCAQLSLLYGEDGKPAPPKLRFAGAHLFVTELEGRGGVRRKAAENALRTLTEQETKVSVPFADVAPALVDLLFAHEEALTSGILDELVAQNRDVDVQIEITAVTEENVRGYVIDALEGRNAALMHLKFSVAAEGISDPE